MKKILLMALLLLFPFRVYAEEAVDLAPNAKSAILIEATTGEILFQKNVHEKLAPASMTKIMSMLLFIEALEKGLMKWDEYITISEKAAGMGGSQIFLEPNEKMSITDLFKGVAIASANDATYALAERVAGTEEAFVNKMNKRLKELGLKNSYFKNSTGLDEANHYSTAYDMAMMAKELVNHDKVLEFTSKYEDYLRVNTDEKFWLVNTNRLVRFYPGVDGLKTGYTTEAGYCLTATIEKNNMRLIAVVMGEPESSTRNAEVSRMLDYGFNQYEVERILSKNTDLGSVRIDKGSPELVGIRPVQNINVLNKKGEDKKEVTYQIKLDKIKAPIKIGDKVGTLTIIENNKELMKINITVKEEVKKARFFTLYLRHIKDILLGNIKI
jgi:D-alanyl-D-alanine carboxypeptidase (penicillin-binding protein 5/6)